MMITLPAPQRLVVAAAIGVHEQYLYQCLTGRRKLPAEHAPGIERATAGRITCGELRPDVRWVRVPDADWPHPEGRPCIDVAAPVQDAQRAAA
jgi:DNA-binding transcriptional regulator YdaS (Cro superfamily)